MCGDVAGGGERCRGARARDLAPDAHDQLAPLPHQQVGHRPRSRRLLVWGRRRRLQGGAISR